MPDAILRFGEALIDTIVEHNALLLVIVALLAIAALAWFDSHKESRRNDSRRGTRSLTD